MDKTATHRPSPSLGAPSPRFLAALLFLAWLSLAWVVLKYGLVFTFLREGIWAVDYFKHHEAAVRILNGQSPFDGSLYLAFNYPLFTAWLFVFLGWMSVEMGELVWDACHVSFTLIGIAATMLYLRPGRGIDSARLAPAGDPSPVQAWAAQHWASVMAVAMAAFAPAFADLHYSNIEPLNFMLLLFLCIALHRDRQALAGVCLAMLCLIKILPFALVPIILIAGKRKAILSWGIFLGIYGAILLVTGWWRWEWFLITQTLPNLGHYWMGLSGSLVRIFGVCFEPAVIESKETFRLASIIIAVAMLSLHAMALGAGWPLVRRSWREALAATSLVVVLCSPLLEYRHFVFCLPAYILLILDYAEGRTGHVYFATALALWLALFTCRVATAQLPFDNRDLPYFIATGFAFTLWAMSVTRIVWLARRLPPQPTTS